MIKSMTGYASSTIDRDEQQINIELKTVNNRFLNINFKLMSGMERYESMIRKTIQDKVKRGSITIIIKLKNNNVTNDFQINQEYAKAVVNDLQKTAKELCISRDISLDTLLMMPNFIEEKSSQEHDEKALSQMIEEELNNVLNDLNQMRTNEGQRLKITIEDSLERINNIHKELSLSYENVKKQMADEIFSKISKAAELISNDIKLEKSDIVKEIAVLVEKADITEELNRISSHSKEMENVLNNNDSVGKKLDFICQEFNREFNTIVSKTKIYDISKTALAGKYEVETIREQVQNLE
ncbi:MAG: YicC family protein [Planctomycetota bacterium]|nr:MAG: YicC family protein [Planctomycetota bacterium]